MAVHSNAIHVIGTGPVGLAFALRVANQGQAVVLIDSGAWGASQRGLLDGSIRSALDAPNVVDDQLVADGSIYSIGDRYLGKSRALGLGGSALLWRVRARPDGADRVRVVRGDPSDFDARPRLGIPGWPGNAMGVLDRYSDALEFLELTEAGFEADDAIPVGKPLPLDPHDMPLRFFQFPAREVVIERRLQDAIDHPGIEVVSDHHLVGIETEGQRQVTEVRFATRDGIRRMSTSHLVLALGGVENSRQLLLAADAGALVDRHDTFGRWFADHPHTRLGHLVNPDAALRESMAFYDFHDVDGAPVLAGHEIGDELAESERLLRFSLDFVGRPVGEASRTGVDLARAWATYRRHGRGGFATHLPRLARSPKKAAALVRSYRNTPMHGTAFGGWSDPASRLYDVGSLSVEAMFEQRPSPDNRIVLSRRSDSLGRRLPQVHWLFSRTEIDSIIRAADLVKDVLRDAGVDGFITMRELGEGPLPRAGSGFHHLGGTRQSDDPADGVVDADNRVHGVDNLLVVGGSVFPNTVGFANPTLTAIADSIRTADALLAR